MSLPLQLHYNSQDFNLIISLKIHIMCKDRTGNISCLCAFCFAKKICSEETNTRRKKEKRKRGRQVEWVDNP